jgi:hypothetical protein
MSAAYFVIMFVTTASAMGIGFWLGFMVATEWHKQ